MQKCKNVVNKSSTTFLNVSTDSGNRRNLLKKYPRKLRKQANYGFVSFPKTVDCSLLPYIPVHLVIHLKHPLRKFGFGIGDEVFGHLTIKSVCHRAGNGAKRVGIAAQRDGQLETIDIVLALQEADERRRDGLLAGLVKAVVRLDVGIRQPGPVRIVFVQHMAADVVLIPALHPAEDGQSRSDSALDALGMVVRRKGGLGGQVNALLCTFCHKTRSGDAHAAAVAVGMIGRLQLTRREPAGKTSAKAPEEVRAASGPQRFSHIRALQQGFGTGKVTDYFRK